MLQQLANFESGTNGGSMSDLVTFQEIVVQHGEAHAVRLLQVLEEVVRQKENEAILRQRFEQRWDHAMRILAAA